MDATARAGARQRVPLLDVLPRDDGRSRALLRAARRELVALGLFGAGVAVGSLATAVLFGWLIW